MGPAHRSQFLPKKSWGTQWGAHQILERKSSKDGWKVNWDKLTRHGGTGLRFQLEGKLRQEYHKIKAHLSYTVNSKASLSNLAEILNQKIKSES